MTYVRIDKLRYDSDRLNIRVNLTATALGKPGSVG
jgi:hypothetical protein